MRIGQLIITVPAATCPLRSGTLWLALATATTAVCVIDLSTTRGDDAVSDRDTQPAANALTKAGGHWGEDRVGFRWVEDDSRDGRMNQMDTGSHMTSALDVPVAGGGTETLTKALSISVGDADGQPLAAVCYDLRVAAIRCGWAGKMLNYSPARYGLIERPRIAGTPRFTAPAGNPWNGRKVAYKGLYVHGHRVVLESRVDGVRVLESPWAVNAPEGVAFRRSLRIESAQFPLETVVADPPASAILRGGDGRARLDVDSDGRTRLRVAAGSEAIDVSIWIAASADVAMAAAEIETAPEDLLPLVAAGPKRWETITTTGTLGSSATAYTVDTITLPFGNPFGALMFVGGHDFFSQPERAAICTVHGDVWLADGIDDELDEIRWQRFATGLFQPLGIKIVDDSVYVLGRDQLTRLHDTNNDGQADFYESFNNAADTSAGGHDYSGGLETDADGNFYYVSHRGVHRISADGSRYETIATGLRNPIAMSIGPRDTVTAAPQEGEWTPASAIFEVTENGYFGFGGPRVTADRPLGYDRPLCWLPRLVDNSTGGQVWVTSNRWGPVEGALINLSFGQCRTQLLLLEPREFTVPDHWPALEDRRHGSVARGTIPPTARFVQAAAVPLPFHFTSGVMRGRFHPGDGQLYVSGMRGWVSVATEDGCFARVRYTGGPTRLPIAIRTLANGIALQFDVPLDEDAATDPRNYSIEQWNYRYAADYGSPDFRPSQPGSQGHDRVDVLSATRLDDATVFLELPDVQPVMQMSIAYAIKAGDGAAMRNMLYHTINAVPEITISPDRLTRRAETRPTISNPLPGLRWEFHVDRAGGGQTDVRTGRTASLFVPEGEPITSLLPPGSFETIATGYLRVPLPDRYTFAFEGQGTVRLRINNLDVMAGAGDLGALPRRTVPLFGGLNRIELHYAPPSSGAAAVRTWWGSDAFASEPIPPTVLFHDANDSDLQRQTRIRHGRALFATHRCGKCHSLPAPVEEIPVDLRMPELALDAPRLAGLAERLQPRWVAQWLSAPDSLRHEPTMPRLFPEDSATGRQQAADVAAFLAGDAATRLDDDGPVEPAADQVAVGERLFEDLSCLACHCLTGPSHRDPFGRLSLAAVGHKFRRGALVRFLREPHANHASSPMPRFDLTAEEAGGLAAFLRNQTAQPLADWTADIRGDAERGRQLYDARNCAACHEPEKRLPVPGPAIAFGRPHSDGCLRAAEHGGPAPRFSLTARDREDLALFLAGTTGASLGHRCTSEAAERLIVHFRCAACHDRDGIRSQRGEIIIEEGRGLAPEPLPSLTWAGEKLHADWTRRLLAGEIRRPSRAWLRGRMPAFPRFADTIADGLARQHGVQGEHGPAAPYDAEHANLGRLLTLKSGLDCRQCHGIGPLEPRGDDRTKIAPGINFADTAQRIRYDYYLRFVLDPARYDRATKMPKVAADGLTTSVTGVFEGDARRQFDAIWHFIKHHEQTMNAYEPP